MQEPDPSRLRARSLFLSATIRAGFPAGWVDRVPCHFSEIPRLIRRGEQRCDGDDAGLADGRARLLLDQPWARISRWRRSGVPWWCWRSTRTCPSPSGACHARISQVSALVEQRTAARGRPAADRRGAAHHRRACGRPGARRRHAAATDWAGIPDGGDPTARQARPGHHTEMMGDGLWSLVERRGHLPARELHARAHRRHLRHGHRAALPCDAPQSDAGNAPGRLHQRSGDRRANDNLVAINASLQIDLAGQCCSESFGPTPFSGTGGRGRLHARGQSLGGRARHHRAAVDRPLGGTVSRIVPVLSPGQLRLHRKNDINHVVTEHGVARLRGRSLRASDARRR